MKISFKKIGDVLLHETVEHVLWGTFAVFCCGVLGWMLITIAADIASFHQTKTERAAAIARKSRVVACVERRYKVKHIIFDMFEEADGNRFSVSNYGECGDNPDQ